jgi:CheY-like chemotaxis protein
MSNENKNKRVKGIDSYTLPIKMANPPIRVSSCQTSKGSPKKLIKPTCCFTSLRTNIMHWFSRLELYINKLRNKKSFQQETKKENTADTKATKNKALDNDRRGSSASTATSCTSKINQLTEVDRLDKTAALKLLPDTSYNSFINASLSDYVTLKERSNIITNETEEAWTNVTDEELEVIGFGRERMHVLGSDFTKINQNESILYNRNILIVDDTVLNVKLAMKALGNKQIILDVAENGKICIEKLQQKNYDIILMDLEMPVMDGCEATHYIRKTLGLDIPIIALTTNNLPGIMQKCLNSGMNDYLLKPYKHEQLISIISKHLKKDQTEAINEHRPNHEAKTKEENANKKEQTIFQEESLIRRSNKKSEVIRYRKYKNLLETVNYKNVDKIYEHININSLKEYCDEDEDFENALKEQYLKDFPGYMGALRKSILTKNFSEIKSISHKMKSGVALLGLNETRNQLTLIEKYALMQNIDEIISIFRECKISLDKSIMNLSICEENKKFTHF